MAEITGGCACGKVRFEITADPVGGGICHCRACQYAAGGPPTHVVLVPKMAFKVTKGEPKVYTTKGDSGADVGRAFCGDCGTPLYSIPGPLTPFFPVKVGALDDPSLFKPNLHLYMDEAQPWHLTHEGLPQFPKMPPMAPPGAS